MWRKQIKGNWTQVERVEAGGRRTEETSHPGKTEPRWNKLDQPPDPSPTEITFLADSLRITAPISTQSRVSVSAWREPDGSSGSKHSSMKYVCP